MVLNSLRMLLMDQFNKVMDTIVVGMTLSQVCFGTAMLLFSEEINNHCWQGTKCRGWMTREALSLPSLGLNQICYLFCLLIRNS